MNRSRIGTRMDAYEQISFLSAQVLLLVLRYRMLYDGVWSFAPDA